MLSCVQRIEITSICTFTNYASATIANAIMDARRVSIIPSSFTSTTTAMNHASMSITIMIIRMMKAGAASCEVR